MKSIYDGSGSRGITNSSSVGVLIESKSDQGDAKEGTGKTKEDGNFRQDRFHAQSTDDNIIHVWVMLASPSASRQVSASKKTRRSPMAR